MAPCSPTDASEVLASRNFSIPLRFFPNFTLCLVSYTISRVPCENLCILTYEPYSENCDSGIYRHSFQWKNMQCFGSLEAKGSYHGIMYLTCLCEFLRMNNFLFQKCIHIYNQWSTCDDPVHWSHDNSSHQPLPQSETAFIYADIIAPHQLLNTTN